MNASRGTGGILSRRAVLARAGRAAAAVTGATLLPGAAEAHGLFGHRHAVPTCPPAPACVPAAGPPAAQLGPPYCPFELIAMSYDQFDYLSRPCGLGGPQPEMRMVTHRDAASRLGCWGGSCTYAPSADFPADPRFNDPPVNATPAISPALGAFGYPSLWMQDAVPASPVSPSTSFRFQGYNHRVEFPDGMAPPCGRSVTVRFYNYVARSQAYKHDYPAPWQVAGGRRIADGSTNVRPTTVSQANAVFCRPHPWALPHYYQIRPLAEIDADPSGNLGPRFAYHVLLTR